MYSSKFDNDVDDDCSCEEIIVSRRPKSSYHFRKKDIKKMKDTSHQKSIDEFDPCVCPEENLQYIKSINREIIKSSSTLKDTYETDPDKSKKKKRNKTNKIITKKRNNVCRTKEIDDPAYSIIYCNKFEDDEQLQDFLFPFRATSTQENAEWNESDISTCTFPIIEKLSNCTGTCNNIERKSDSREIKLKDPFCDIPSIPHCDLPDLIEKKPEPEVLATVLLLSEKDNLREAKPNVIFDKLFLNLTSRQNFTTDMIDKVNDHKATNTIDNLANFQLDDTLIEKFLKEHEDTDTTVSLPQNLKDNTQEKWTKDDMLEYMMKVEVTPAYRNYVRLNGSVKPSWFPGYALVSPLIPNCIRITSDPGEALLEAWRLCRPRHFDEFSKSFLNTA
ncbi:uncharacterized protein LOC124956747 [Vespa velutina]|uniref:uncharacterized protein LOC124956747 n=1 Tax=Vespa velutina TaxID=202808 RepID=UPI001FB474CA|nr:uncharacterized protein LOC124956747 [Vespa velutina]